MWLGNRYIEKNKTRTALILQYYMKCYQEKEYFIYTLVPDNMYEGNIMWSGQYYCEIFDLKTGTWWRCDIKNIKQWRGLSDSVYSDETVKTIHKRKRNNDEMFK